MAAQDGLTFEGTFNNSSSGLFKTNTTKDIGSDDMRTLVTAIKESYLNRIDDLVDEDNMASNSAVKVPTQQSVKAYVDNAALGIVTSWKAPVVNATTANITLSGEQTIDGVLTSASRILVKNQSTQSENGIYVTAAGAWARSSDANTAAELEGAAVTVQQGTSNANTTWTQTTDGITLGSSNIVWAQLGSSVPDASETTKGIAELATQAETNTGTDDARIVTPLKLKTFVNANAPKVLVIACSDEITPITASTGKVTFRMPYAMTLSAVRASLTTAQTSGSTFTVDINEAGTTILSTKITIDNGEKTSTTAATPPVISDTSLADDAEITIDVDQQGDNTAKGLKVYLIGS